MKNNVIRREELLKAFGEVLEVLATTVKSTYGPYGTTVGYVSSDGVPVISKDGMKVLSKVRFEGEVGETLAGMIIEPSISISKNSGDGTSSVIVFMEGLFNRLKDITPLEAKRLRDRFNNEMLPVIRKELEDNCKKIESVEDIMDVASVALDGEQSLLGLIKDAFTSVDDIVFFKRGLTEQVKAEKGFSINSIPMLNPMGNMKDGSLYLENTKVLHIESPLQTDAHLNFIIPLITKHAEAGINFTLITEALSVKARHVFKNMLSVLNQHDIKVAVLEHQGAGKESRENIGDMGSFLGKSSFYIPDDIKDFDKERITELYTEVAKNYIAEANISALNDNLIIMRDNEDNTYLKMKLDYLQSQKEDAVYRRDDMMVKKMSTRIGRLNGVIKRIHIAGATDTLTERRMDAIEDALAAIASAKSYGVVLGAGKSLRDALHKTATLHDDLSLTLAMTHLLNSLDKGQDILDKALIEAPEGMTYDLVKEEYTNKIIEPLETSLDILRVGVNVILEALSLQQLLTVDYNSDVYL